MNYNNPLWYFFIPVIFPLMQMWQPGVHDQWESNHHWITWCKCCEDNTHSPWSWKVSRLTFRNYRDALFGITYVGGNSYSRKTMMLAVSKASTGSGEADYGWGGGRWGCSRIGGGNYTSIYRYKLKKLKQTTFKYLYSNKINIKKTSTGGTKVHQHTHHLAHCPAQCMEVYNRSDTLALHPYWCH